MPDARFPLFPGLMLTLWGAAIVIWVFADPHDSRFPAGKGAAAAFGAMIFFCGLLLLSLRIIPPGRLSGGGALTLKGMVAAIVTCFAGLLALVVLPGYLAFSPLVLILGCIALLLWGSIIFDIVRVLSRRHDRS